VPAEEGHDDRPFGQQLVALHQAAGGIGQQEVREGIADANRMQRGAVALQLGDRLGDALVQPW
jgi:hypothetical protein